MLDPRDHFPLHVRVTGVVHLDANARGTSAFINGSCLPRLSVTQSRERARERQLVALRVAQVEVPLAPGRVLRPLWSKSLLG